MVTTSSGPQLRLRLRLLLARHRRVVVAVLLALAAASALSSLRPAPPSTVPVLVARRDLPAGHRLLPGDLLTVAWAASAAPRGTVSRPTGQVLASPVRRGEPITDVRLRDTARPGRFPRDTRGRVVVTIRLTDPASAVLAAPGDHLQVIAGPPQDPLAGLGPDPGSSQTPRAPSGSPSGAPSGSARIVVEDALVLQTPAVPPHRPASSPPSGGGLLGALDTSATNDSAQGSTNVPGTGTGAGALPAGVLAVAVRPADALDLATVTGNRALTVARRLTTDDA